MGNSYEVPGFFPEMVAGGLSGDVWRTIFQRMKRVPGIIVRRFVEAGEVAVSQDRNAGGPRRTLMVREGRFEVASLRRLRARVSIVGGDSSTRAVITLNWEGPYWLKGGTDSPEDFLAYVGLCEYPKGKAPVREPRRGLAQGDPDWGGGKGKGIIGALNYLAAKK